VKSRDEPRDVGSCAARQHPVASLPPSLASSRHVAPHTREMAGRARHDGAEVSQAARDASQLGQRDVRAEFGSALQGGQALLQLGPLAVRHRHRGRHCVDAPAQIDQRLGRIVARARRLVLGSGQRQAAALEHLVHNAIDLRAEVFRVGGHPDVIEVCRNDDAARIHAQLVAHAGQRQLAQRRGHCLLECWQEPSAHRAPRVPHRHATPADAKILCRLSRPGQPTKRRRDVRNCTECAFRDAGQDGTHCDVTEPILGQSLIETCERPVAHDANLRVTLLLQGTSALGIAHDRHQGHDDAQVARLSDLKPALTELLLDLRVHLSGVLAGASVVRVMLLRHRAQFALQVWPQLIQRKIQALPQAPSYIEPDAGGVDRDDVAGVQLEMTWARGAEVAVLAVKPLPLLRLEVATSDAVVLEQERPRARSSKAGSVPRIGNGSAVQVRVAGAEFGVDVERQLGKCLA